ncbi:sulfotransferase [Rivularia sp. UHCC 0363]|uniref:sulfotransferase family protein n=1 Tax=Rivularia sp. UHCC 0363 TaxID=3110244 RepID=UPI002B1F8436|nr:sulfotransferase [Rivularia sp. UHCC 0363]MEA5596118.1 sulfotransferase [Rivularia sp. UHCC 0363]
METKILESKNMSQTIFIARFITGMSRGGTTWLGKCLNEHPDTAVFGESLFWGRAYIQPQEDGTYSQKQVDNILSRLIQHGCEAFLGKGNGNLKNITPNNLKNLIPTAFGNTEFVPTPVSVFKKICQTICEAESKKITIEKTPHHVNWIDRIIRAMPNSRFVIMIREPYGFMLSYKHQGDRWQEPERTKFKRLYHPLICSLLWRGYIRAATYATHSYAQNTLVVRTEDMKSDSEAVLNEVQKFFLLNPVSKLASKIPPDNSSFLIAERPSLKSEDIFWMNLVASKEISQFGFEKQSSMIEPLRILCSILQLPIWTIRNFIHLNNETSGSVFQYLMRWFR